MTQLIKEAEEWISSIHYNADHLLRTGYWVTQLDPDASEELIVACVTHDVERTFSDGRVPQGSDEEGENIIWDDEVYNLWHGKRSAEFVRKFLESKKASEDFIQKVEHIIERHEMGGDPEQNLIQAADSISFLEINAARFIKNIPKKYTKDQVKEKFDYMYNRIQIPKGKELAEPFYRKALQDLDLL
ncbi:DUF4202 family protein [Candidatus Woesebacteria bacterium]|nr:DUF4202 family protein [Candidatus Woesebacteria bacterium]